MTDFDALEHEEAVLLAEIAERQARLTAIRKEYQRGLEELSKRRQAASGRRIHVPRASSQEEQQLVKRIEEVAEFWARGRVPR